MAQLPVVQIAVRYTFVHFECNEECAQPRRSRSAPAAFSYQAADAPSQRKKHRRNRAAKENVEAVLREYGKRASRERWAHFAKKISQLQQASAVVVAYKQCAEKQEALQRPRHRATLSADAFKEFEYLFLGDERDTLMFKLIGALREVDDTIEFWFADVLMEDAKTQRLIAEAQRRRRLTTLCAFQMIAEGADPVVFKFYEQLTVEHLSLVVEYHYCIKPERIKC